VNVCVKNTSSPGDAALGIAAFMALAYGIWNWAHRQRRKGSSVGQSVLKFEGVSSHNRQRPGFLVKRIVGAVVVVLVGSMGTMILARLTINGSTTSCYKAEGSYPGTYLVDYETCRGLGA
jgi:hypothetical protein